MHSRLWAIARYTLLEHLRGRMAWCAALLVLFALLLESLLDGMALTEAAALQGTLTAATLRLAMVLLLAGSVIVSQVREGSDRTRDWLLAFAMPRAHWLAGRLLGHLLAALLLAMVAGLSLLPAVGPAAAALWAGSLSLELMLCTCMALFLSLNVAQAPAALLAFAGWYVLARTLAALQLMATAPMLADGSLWITLAPGCLQLLGLFLPRLDLFAQLPLLPSGTLTVTAWPDLLARTATYGVLLGLASLLDLQRREW